MSLAKALSLLTPIPRYTTRASFFPPLRNGFVSGSLFAKMGASGRILSSLFKTVTAPAAINFLMPSVFKFKSLARCFVSTGCQLFSPYWYLAYNTFFTCTSISSQPSLPFLIASLIFSIMMLWDWKWQKILYWYLIKNFLILYGNKKWINFT